jgi:hypothetical protein
LIRIAVLIDSDRLVPPERLPNHDMADLLRADGVEVHVLALREAENYVPNRILASCGNPSTASITLTRLGNLHPDQRGHYDMKKGYGRGSSPAPTPPRFDRHCPR